LRRFGNISDPGDGHWFNLDSTKHQPQWISKLYLGMVLQQAESDGYSVFAVTQIDPEAQSQLPHTDADDIASTLPDPTSSAARDDVEPGFENEDLELQAALQASLMGTGELGGSSAVSSSYLPAPPNPSVPVIPSSSHLTGRAGLGVPGIPPNQDPYGNADVNPVVASMERDRVLMERIRREQEIGFRQQYDEEVARFRNQQRPPFRAQARGNEDEYFHHAITEPLAQRQARGNYDDDDSEDADYVTPPEVEMHSMGQQNRVYDDDDADFQAALRASLESAPPEFSPLPVLQTRQPPSTHISTTAEDETDNQSEADTSTIASETGPSEEVLSMEEMRRRRLARFG
jgi:Ataxin-3